MDKQYRGPLPPGPPTPQHPSQGSGPGQDLKDVGGGHPESGAPSFTSHSRPSQTNCKNCSWSKWSSARNWSENFRVSKVPPHPPTSPHLSARTFFLCARTPGQAAAAARPVRAAEPSFSRGFLLGRRPKGWGREWGVGKWGRGRGLCVTALT